MELNRKLVMTFKTTDDKKVSLTVDNYKAMCYIKAGNFLGRGSTARLGGKRDEKTGWRLHCRPVRRPHGGD